MCCFLTHVLAGGFLVFRDPKRAMFIVLALPESHKGVEQLGELLGSHLSTSWGVCHSLGTSELGAKSQSSLPFRALPVQVKKGFPKDFQANLRRNFQGLVASKRTHQSGAE